MFLGDMMQSEDPLQAEIEPVPEDMQALADHLKKQNPPSDVSSYAYRLALLGQVIYEISPIHLYFLNVLLLKLFRKQSHVTSKCVKISRIGLF